MHEVEILEHDNPHHKTASAGFEEIQLNQRRYEL